MIYEFKCETCKKVTKKDFDVRKPTPKRTKCKCGKFAKKVFHCPAVHYKGDFKEKKRHGKEQFTNRATVKKFYEDSIEASKRRMKTGSEAYVRYNYDYDALEKMGVCKRKNKAQADRDYENVSDIGNKLAEKHRK